MKETIEIPRAIDYMNEPVRWSDWLDFLGRLENELQNREEFWRNIPSDPHQIASAVMTAMRETHKATRTVTDEVVTRKRDFFGAGLDQMTELQAEKKRRINYQSIVYDVCNLLDVANNKRIGSGICCGDGDNPTRETQEAVKALISERDWLSHRVAELARSIRTGGGGAELGDENGGAKSAAQRANKQISDSDQMPNERK